MRAERLAWRTALSFLAALTLMLGLAFTAAGCDGPAETPTPADDRVALVALYHATDGPSWTINVNWLSEAPLGTWYGITTDSRGRVTRLDLSTNQLRGAIPPALGRLHNLDFLALAENQLRGTIPRELGGLSRLELLMLNDNQLHGEIPPELANLAKLRVLLLGGSNHLTGCIPEELGAAPVADFAALRLPFCDAGGRVPFAAGPAPTEAPTAARAADRDALAALYHATDGPNWTTTTNWLTNTAIGEWHGVTTDPTGRVVELRLPDNQLAGEIPPELGSLAQLELLALTGNRLSGAIPPELGNLANLAALSLYGNQLSGAIPPQLGRLAQLRWLDLNKNQLSGTIPPELGNLALLEALDLSTNQVSGQIPPELGRLAQLEWLALWGNWLTGTIPSELGRLAKLGVFSIHGNLLSGAMPPELGNLSRLQMLTLGGGNGLSGCIPRELQDVWSSDLDTLGLPYCGAN